MKSHVFPGLVAFACGPGPTSSLLFCIALGSEDHLAAKELAVAEKQMVLQQMCTAWPMPCNKGIVPARL
jgi:hypothetical protein